MRHGLFVDQPATETASAREELNDLMRQVVARDKGALRALYERTAAKLYGISLRLLRDEAEAQDVLQDVYVTVWNKAAMFDAKRASPITWLATMTRNRAIDALRARRAPAEQLDAALAIPDDRPSSLDVLEQVEDGLRLHRCLEELEQKAGKAIRTAFFEGATYVEIAERDGVPLPTVKSWIRRGLIRLRGCLEQ